MVGHVTSEPAQPLDQLPGWATLVRAANPGPMTLDGTNTWVLRADGAPSAVVIDPGPDDPDHLAAIAGYVPIGLILVTHGHPDHVEGLHRLVAMLGDVPVAAGGTLPVVEHGLDISVLPTPGHTSDSVSYVVTAGAERAVFTGDTILGRGTTVVAYPDGDLGQYLASLDRLAEYEGFAALPGHGPALVDCAAAARFYRAHREARLEQVRQAVAAGATDAEDVVATVYADVDRILWPAAELSVRAQLAYLQDRGEWTPPTSPLDPP